MMEARIWRWVPAVLVMILIFIASATPGSELPDFAKWDFFLKKSGHMLGYALLAAAYYHALSKGRGTARFHFASAIVLATLYAVSDEWHQKFIPGRTPSPRDVCIDLAGGCVGIALWILLSRYLPFTKKQKPPAG